MNLQMDPPRIRFEIITGSSRARGNSERVADHIVETLSGQGVDASILRLREFDIAACGACGECNTRETPCAQRDDMPIIIERLVAANAIIYVAPVHGYGLAHPMQIFIERAGVGYLRFNRPLANKVAGCVITGRRYGHVSVFNQITNNILLNRMILVGSGYPTVLLGGAPGKALEDAEGLQSVHSLVARMVGMARLLRMVPKAAMESCLTPLSENERLMAAAQRPDAARGDARSDTP
ncbi:flavodoxin family protein [Roseibium sp. Sym1]|uniref:flavodoxin family protein n=1 Tax=Roseibium sp. Sym1 TaxID=3016006 RepID=UPI0022B445E7|nr:flavodoxin family protein [Roseibium sp. Sym1]